MNGSDEPAVGWESEKRSNHHHPQKEAERCIEPSSINLEESTDQNQQELLTNTGIEAKKSSEPAQRCLKSCSDIVSLLAKEDEIAATIEEDNFDSFTLGDKLQMAMKTNALNESMDRERLEHKSIPLYE